jgi:death on curing protein
MRNQIERYGGSAGVRDLGVLEAALFRPQTCARLTAGASETESFLLDFYDAGTFNFARLSRWLNGNVAFDVRE